MKRVIACTLALAMMLSVAGCGSTKPSDSSGSGSTTSVNSSQQTPKMNTAQADADLDAMLTDADAPIPGYSVMAFKMGNFAMRERGVTSILMPMTVQTTLPSAKRPASGRHPSPRFLLELRSWAW